MVCRGNGRVVAVDAFGVALAGSAGRTEWVRRGGQPNEVGYSWAIVGSVEDGLDGSCMRARAVSPRAAAVSTSAAPWRSPFQLQNVRALTSRPCSPRANVPAPARLALLCSPQAFERPHICNNSPKLTSPLFRIEYCADSRCENKVARITFRDCLPASSWIDTLALDPWNAPGPLSALS